MSSSTLTPKQLEVIGKIVTHQQRLSEVEDPFRNPTLQSITTAAVEFRNAALILDEVAACLTGEGSEAFKEALTNV